MCPITQSTLSQRYQRARNSFTIQTRGNSVDDGPTNPPGLSDITPFHIYQTDFYSVSNLRRFRGVFACVPPRWADSILQRAWGTKIYVQNFNCSLFACVYACCFVLTFKTVKIYLFWLRLRSVGRLLYAIDWDILKAVHGIVYCHWLTEFNYVIN